MTNIMDVLVIEDFLLNLEVFNKFFFVLIFLIVKSVCSKTLQFKAYFI
jgi:hypothetical protein